MIPKQDGLRLEEVLGARVSWRLFRVLLERPYLSFSPTALAAALGTSRASVLRVLRVLVRHSLVLAMKSRRYRANIEHAIVQRLWSLFMQERWMNLQPPFKNAIEVFFETVKDKVDVLIVFGSVARGLASPESDIDICVIGEDVSQYRFDFLPYRFEVHTYQQTDLANLTDLVIFDALLNGIVLKGEDFVFNVLKNLDSFPKVYLLYRLNKAKHFRRRSEELTGEARSYYASLAEVAVREVESVFYQGTTLSKREIPLNGQFDIPQLEAELARQGERIWLT